jgi:hypothetical protein
LLLLPRAARKELLLLEVERARKGK